MCNSLSNSKPVNVTAIISETTGGPPTPPPHPLIYWGDLSVTGNGDLPLATQRRVESIASDRSPFSMRKVDGWQTLATKPIDQPKATPQLCAEQQGT